MTNISPVDAQESVIGLDPSIHGSDGVVEDLNNEDTGFWTTSADPDTKMFPSLTLQGHGQQLLVDPQVGVGHPPVLLDPLPVDPQPQHGGHLAESSANLTNDVK